MKSEGNYYKVDSNIRRNIWGTISIMLLAVVVGLASRKFANHLPEWNTLYLGDSIWAFMVYWGFATLFFKKRALYIAVFAIIFSFSIEFSQLYQAEWINNLRANRLIALVLGKGFLWSDLPAYFIGILAAFAVDLWLNENRTTTKRTDKVK